MVFSCILDKYWCICGVTFWGIACKYVCRLCSSSPTWVAVVLFAGLCFDQDNPAIFPEMLLFNVALGVRFGNIYQRILSIDFTRSSSFLML